MTKIQEIVIFSLYSKFDKLAKKIVQQVLRDCRKEKASIFKNRRKFNCDKIFSMISHIMTIYDIFFSKMS